MDQKHISGAIKNILFPWFKLLFVSSCNHVLSHWGHSTVAPGSTLFHRNGILLSWIICLGKHGNYSIINRKIDLRLAVSLWFFTGAALQNPLRGKISNSSTLKIYKVYHACFFCYPLPPYVNR